MCLSAPRYSSSVWYEYFTHSNSHNAHKLTIDFQFDSEADVWYENMPSILEQNITIPGASPLFPDAHCIASGEVCQLTLGEGGL